MGIASISPQLGEDKPNSEYKIGYVSHVFLDKGYSLMSTKQNQAVLVSKNIIEPSKLVLGEACAVRVRAKEAGDLFAIAPLYLLKGGTTPGIPITFGDYEGICKQPQQNGDMFVDCADVKFAHAGRDAYIHSSVVQECQLAEGDGICFSLHLNKAGLPQVPKPVWKRCRQGAGQTSGELDEEFFFGWVMDASVEQQFCSIYSNTFGMLTAMPIVVDPQLLNPGELVAFGAKKRLNNWAPDRVAAPLMKFCGQPNKSYYESFGKYIGKVSDDAESFTAMAAGKGTFVQCLAASEQFGRDVWAHKAVMSECGLVPGDVICFNVHINKLQWPQLTAPVWKIVSPQTPKSNWMKSDTIKPDSAQKLPGAGKWMPMLPMADVMKVKGAEKSKVQKIDPKTGWIDFTANADPATGAPHEPKVDPETGWIDFGPGGGGRKHGNHYGGAGGARDWGALLRERQMAALMAQHAGMWHSWDAMGAMGYDYTNPAGMMQSHENPVGQGTKAQQMLAHMQGLWQSSPSSSQAAPEPKTMGDLSDPQKELMLNQLLWQSSQAAQAAESGGLEPDPAAQAADESAAAPEEAPKKRFLSW